MKTILVHSFGGPEVLQLAEVPTPEPAADEILVRVKAVGINPVETYLRAGAYPIKPPLPYTPGTDAAGVIEKVGSAIKTFEAGDRVYVDGAKQGTYAEYALCEADDVHRLPESVSFEQGAAVGVPYATAYRAVIDRGQALPGETLLVHGASGGMGLAAVQIAVARGLRVFGTASTPQGRELVARQGAIQVFDHSEANYLEKIRAATEGRGVDVIVESLANVNLAKDLTLLAPRGRVVVVGSRGRIEIDPRDTMMRDADIRGLRLGNATPEEARRIHAALVAGLENGTLRPAIGRRFALAQAADAHRAIMEPGAQGKIVLLP